MGLAAPRHVGSSQSRDQNRVSCIGRWILYHWATREAQVLFKYAYSSFVGLLWRNVYSNSFSSVQLLSRVWLFATPWITACQASLSITISRSSLKLMSIESVMPSRHLILHRPLLLLPPSPPSIRVFSNESTLHMRWPKYWSFSFSIIPSKGTSLPIS